MGIACASVRKAQRDRDACSFVFSSFFEMELSSVFGMFASGQVCLAILSRECLLGLMGTGELCGRERRRVTAMLCGRCAGVRVYRLS